ncbi:MAG: amidohydrolase [Candidatus Heimdallarchaeota archaeon]
MSDSIKLNEKKEQAVKWVNEHEKWISDFHQKIWYLAEPALREYESAAVYVEVLKKEGFNIEEGSGEMPTAFCAVWGEGKPILATFAEYDATPGNNQAPTPYKKLRDETLHPYAAGHTDPHSALGVTTLAGVLATKHVIEEFGLQGSLKLMGEPAEKVCVSKPYHAAKGYYDDLDASILFHPGSVNRIVSETHCGAYWNIAYTFEAHEPEKWGSPVTPIGWFRANPGALDAVCMMYTLTKSSKEAIHPRTAGWTITEYLSIGGQSNTTPPLISQILYAFRSPTLEMQEKIHEFLTRNAQVVANACGCKVTERIVTKTRVGLHNTTLAKIAYENFKLIGPPTYGETAKSFGRAILKNLGYESMTDPFTNDCQRLLTLEEGERSLRKLLPQWQTHYSSDDYVEYTWHAPSARVYTAKAVLKPIEGARYPTWTALALTGERSTIDPMIFTGAKVIACCFIDLLSNPEILNKAKVEFKERTGGGIGGDKWVPPLLPPDLSPPLDIRWPEYIETKRGREWWIPTPS